MPVPVVHILPLATVLRERLLPVPGRITVRQGQKVNPMDVVARGSDACAYIMVDVAHLLGVEPEAAQGLIRAGVGDSIPLGRLIAQGSGAFRQEVRAPAGGRVVLVDSGKILMETGESILELRAGIPGIVTRLISDRGVEIQFSGAFVQGVWGNGRMDTGLLMPVRQSPDESLSARQLDASLAGSVLLAGTCSDPAALQAANDLPICGLILGSMSPTLIPLAMQVSYPVILVEGFGRQPLNVPAYALLTARARQETTLNAAPLNRHTGVRPEIFIPQPDLLEPPAPRHADSFAPGQAVHLVRAPHAGEVGSLISLQPGLTRMPSGLRTAAAQVRLDSGEQVLVPLANLEILG